VHQDKKAKYKQAIINLKSNPSFLELAEYIKELYEEKKEVLVSSNNDLIRGEAMMLRILNKDFN